MTCLENCNSQAACNAAAKGAPSATPMIYDARLSTGHGVVPLPWALQAPGSKSPRSAP